MNTGSALDYCNNLYNQIDSTNNNLDFKNIFDMDNNDNLSRSINISKYGDPISIAYYKLTNINNYNNKNDKKYDTFSVTFRVNIDYIKKYIESNQENNNIFYIPIILYDNFHSIYNEIKNGVPSISIVKHKDDTYHRITLIINNSDKTFYCYDPNESNYVEDREYNDKRPCLTITEYLLLSLMKDIDVKYKIIKNINMNLLISLKNWFKEKNNKSVDDIKKINDIDNLINNFNNKHIINNHIININNIDIDITNIIINSTEYLMYEGGECEIINLLFIYKLFIVCKNSHKDKSLIENIKYVKHELLKMAQKDVNNVVDNGQKNINKINELNKTKLILFYIYQQNIENFAKEYTDEILNNFYNKYFIYIIITNIYIRINELAKLIYNTNNKNLSNLFNSNIYSIVLFDIDRDGHYFIDNNEKFNGICQDIYNELLNNKPENNILYILKDFYSTYSLNFEEIYPNYESFKNFTKKYIIDFEQIFKKKDKNEYILFDRCLKTYKTYNLC